jgi:hypothetical protein
VQRLGKEPAISLDFVSPGLSDANGHDVVPCGVIDLHWKWHRGTRIHECRFYVFSTSDHLDVLFGVEYIVKEGLITVNESAMAPLTEHKKLTKGTVYRELQY